jgi:hypothetical protein
MVMFRTCGITGALLAVVFLVGTAGADNKADKANKAQKNQMVKGTIKQVEVEKNVLIVNQKVKNEVVQRELDITANVEFMIDTGKEKKKLLGREGLELLAGKEGAEVQVKCDKDVKVLSVSVKLKK